MGIKKRPRIIFINEDKQFDRWTYTPVPENATAPLSWKQTMQYVYGYIRSGKGGIFKKGANLLKRIATCSLKPSHESFDKL